MEDEQDAPRRLSPRRRTAKRIKRKVEDAVINLAVYGLGGLIIWAVSFSFVGENKLNSAVDTVNAKLVDYHNKSVEREAELLERIGKMESELVSKLKGISDEMSRRKPDVPPFPGLPPTPAPPNLPVQQPPNPEQHPITSEILDYIRQHKEVYKK